MNQTLLFLPRMKNPYSYFFFLSNHYHFPPSQCVICPFHSLRLSASSDERSGKGDPSFSWHTKWQKATHVFLHRAVWSQTIQGWLRTFRSTIQNFSGETENTSRQWKPNSLKIIISFLFSPQLLFLLTFAAPIPSHHFQTLSLFLSL